MKFAYLDESGNSEHSDVFVMAGLLIDAYRLHKQTDKFDSMLKDFLCRHPNAPTELKTNSFINGKDGWSLVSANERKNFLMAVCQLATDIADIYGFALLFSAFESTDIRTPSNNNYWSLSGMFICSLIQKYMQKLSHNKGLTVLIIDDNKIDMPKITEGIYSQPEWFDELCQNKIRKKWIAIKQGERFNSIINTPFAIKSNHSSLIQMADAICYVYRRWLELFTEQENWDSEQDFYNQLVGILDAKRKHLSRTPPSECVDFYNSIKHPNWAI